MERSVRAPMAMILYHHLSTVTYRPLTDLGSLGVGSAPDIYCKFKWRLKAPHAAWMTRHSLTYSPTYPDLAQGLTLEVSTSLRLWVCAGRHACTFRRNRIDDAMLQNDVRPRLALTNTTSSPPSVALCEDILFIIFDQFETSDPGSRADCARCARVCTLWSEPALRALWKSLSLSAFLPLYWIFLPDPTSVLIKWRCSSDTEALGQFFQSLGFLGPQEHTELGEYFRKVRVFLRSRYASRTDHQVLCRTSVS